MEKRLAKAETAAAPVTFITIDGRDVLGQVVSPAPAPSTVWVVPDVPTGREITGALPVKTSRRGYWREIAPTPAMKANALALKVGTTRVRADELVPGDHVATRAADPKDGFLYLTVVDAVSTAPHSTAVGGIVWTSVTWPGDQVQRFFDGDRLEILRRAS